MRRQYTTLFAGVRRKELLWATLGLWGPSIILCGLLFTPSSSDQCTALYATLCSAFVLLVIVVAVFRPYRSHVVNVLAATSYGCLSFIFLGSALLSQDPSSDAGKQITVRFVQMQLAVTIVRLAYSAFTSIWERCWGKDVPLKETYSRKGTALTVLSVAETDSEIDDEDAENLERAMRGRLLRGLTPAASPSPSGHGSPRAQQRGAFFGRDGRGVNIDADLMEVAARRDEVADADLPELPEVEFYDDAEEEDAVEMLDIPLRQTSPPSAEHQSPGLRSADSVTHSFRDPDYAYDPQQLCHRRERLARAQLDSIDIHYTFGDGDDEQRLLDDDLLSNPSNLNGSFIIQLTTGDSAVVPDTGRNSAGQGTPNQLLERRRSVTSAGRSPILKPRPPQATPDEIEML